MREKGVRSGCAINAAVEALGDQWSLIVLRDVIFGNRRSFRELLTHSEEGIASNILSSRLGSLVEAGLLTKAETVRGQRGSYSLPSRAFRLCRYWSRSAPGALPIATVRKSCESAPSYYATEGPIWWPGLDELRELHLGIPRPNPSAPRASAQLQAAYEAAVKQ
ncbi:MAG: winged helix-turn-helix transcriptional regulator [Tessaracoccus sp.]